MVVGVVQFVPYSLCSLSNSRHDLVYMKIFGSFVCAAFLYIFTLCLIHINLNLVQLLQIVQFEQNFAFKMRIILLNRIHFIQFHSSHPIINMNEKNINNNQVVILCSIEESFEEVYIHLLKDNLMSVEQHNAHTRVSCSARQYFGL